MANFFWYDIMSVDTKKSESFYRNVMGWNAASAGIGDAPYTVFTAENIGVAGLMNLPEDLPKELGAVWRGYIYVTDVDAHAKRIVDAGGTICRAPWDVPEVGRLLVASDPQGAKFLLMCPISSEKRPIVASGTPGHIGWHELHSTNWESAFTFYSKLFGWSKTEAIDMGPMGIYQTFATESVPVGGMMNTQCENAGSYWLYYFNVKAIDECIAAVVHYGGKVTLEPQQVLGGSWIAQCSDPQGAHFGIVSDTSFSRNQ